MLLALRIELRIHFLLQLVLRTERRVTVQAVLVEDNRQLVVEYDVAHANLRKLEPLPFQVILGVFLYILPSRCAVWSLHRVARGFAWPA